MKPPITIRQLTESDSLSELTTFLNVAYASLAEMGFRYTATWQDVEITKKRIVGGVCLLAESDGKLVGTVTYYPPGSRSNPPEYAQPSVAVFGQLGVAPEFRQNGAGRQLVEHCEKLGKADKATKLMLDTAEPATHLIHWYQKQGYRIIASAD